MMTVSYLGRYNVTVIILFGVDGKSEDCGLDGDWNMSLGALL